MDKAARPSASAMAMAAATIRSRLSACRGPARPAVALRPEDLEAARDLFLWPLPSREPLPYDMRMQYSSAYVIRNGLDAPSLDRPAGRSLHRFHRLLGAAVPVAGSGAFACAAARGLRPPLPDPGRARGLRIGGAAHRVPAGLALVPAALPGRPPEDRPRLRLRRRAARGRPGADHRRVQPVRPDGPGQQRHCWHRSGWPSRSPATGWRAATATSSTAGG